jgi:hypothetical protein
MLAALLVLPLGLPTVLGSPSPTQPVRWLLLALLGSVGLPFFVLSANGPLLQKWFAQTGHPAASDPYFLYVASNLGSMAALLAYPVGIEPFLPLGGAGDSGWFSQGMRLNQSILWSAGYLGLAALTIACAIHVHPTALVVGLLYRRA